VDQPGNSISGGGHLVFWKFLVKLIFQLGAQEKIGV
jgi:hypothetical protein